MPLPEHVPGGMHCARLPAGSGLAVYNETGEIAGVKLPAGLVDGSRLETPIFTPTGKAEVGEHDELVTREELYAEVGQPVGERLEELSLSLYTTAEKIAREQGIILADTKMEFGTDFVPWRDPLWVMRF